MDKYKEIDFKKGYAPGLLKGKAAQEHLEMHKSRIVKKPLMIRVGGRMVPYKEFIASKMKK